MTPLKFLDAYQREDLDIFFGREIETEELYIKVKKSRLFVLYGLSGTGKTSVVRCGLANKFNPVDCLEIYVRRESHIMHSMRKCIQEAADTFISQRDKNIEALRLLYVETLRPIFLIFDQFEEIFISGNKDEIEEFSGFLRAVLSHQTINANILIIIREEYMGQLEVLEPYAPSIYQNKQRLERMNSSTVLTVVKKILAFGHIKYDDPTIPKVIVENAGIKNDMVELPYLQVYLDRLFKIVRSGNVAGAALISQHHMRRVGKLEELLGDFLEKQLTAISAREKDKDTEFGWRILKKMITPEATKKLVSVPILIDDMFDQKSISESDERKLNTYLSHLRNSRIIRLLGDDQMEIAHDILGTEIAKKRTPDELKILESERIVRSKYLSLKTKIKDDLTVEQIRYIQPVEARLKLEPEEKKFIRDSIRRSRIQNAVLKIVATSAISLLIALTLWAMTERNIAEEARVMADSARLSAENAQEIAEAQKSRADSTAQREATAARSLAEQAKVLREQKQQLDAALETATNNERLAKINAKTAEENKEDALRSKAMADTARQRARDREMDAKRERNKTESINLSLQSTMETDSVERIVKALRAYYLNVEFNENDWAPEIVNALIYSNPEASIRELLPIDGPLEDIEDLEKMLVGITALGKFQALDRFTGAGKILSNGEEFYYLNNSAQFDRASQSLTVIDKRKMMYEFTVSSPFFKLINKKRVEIGDSVLQVKGSYMLLNDGIVKLEKGRYDQVIKFKRHQYGSTLEVGPNETFAAGTTDGWLYVFRTGRNPYFMAQFQNKNTSVTDIRFDKRAEFIATGGTDSRLRLTKVAIMKEKLPIEWKFASWVTAVLFGENKSLLVGTSDGKLFSFDFDQDNLATKCCKKLIQLSPEKRPTSDSLVVKNCLNK